MNKLRGTEFKPVRRAISDSGAGTYRIMRTPVQPELGAGLDSPSWKHAALARVDQFHPKSTDHRPQTLVKAMFDDRGIYVSFHVRDRYVCCTHTAYQDVVSRDSCVEFFIQPPDAGYFNFELNCGGALLLYYIEDAARPKPTNGKLFRKYTLVPPELGKLVRIHPTMPRRVEREITDPVDWSLTFFAPWTLFRAFVPNLDPLANPHWRGNFFKCAEDSSHPHWASWNPIGSQLRFHQPDKFGAFEFVNDVPDN